MSELPAVLTVEEAAAVLRISRGSAYEAVRTGDLPHVRIGRTIRVPRRALLALIGEDAPAATVGSTNGAARTATSASSSSAAGVHAEAEG